MHGVVVDGVAAFDGPFAEPAGAQLRSEAAIVHFNFAHELWSFSVKFNELA